MLIRNRRRHLRLLLAALILAWPLAFAGAAEQPSAFPSPFPAPFQCLERFVAAYAKVKTYSTHMHKQEWDEDGGLVHDERIELTFEKPRIVRFKYLNDGSTGIRNNGMTVEYIEGERVKVKLGESKGLGFVVKGVADLVVGGSLSLYDSKVIDDELFTLNRAGFDFLAYAIGFHLEALKKVETEALESVPGEPCHLRYRSHTEGEAAVELEPGESVFPIEERFGTLAYVIYDRNRDQLDTFRDLFVRDRRLSLKVPRSFLPFEMKLDPTTYLPVKFALFTKQKKRIGQYEFKNTRAD